jgi:hypothetical protein
MTCYIDPVAAKKREEDFTQSSQADEKHPRVNTYAHYG